MSPNGGARPKCPPGFMAPGGPAPKSGATKMALPGQKGHKKGHTNRASEFWGSQKSQTRADLRAFDTLLGFWGGESGPLAPVVLAPSGAELRGPRVGAQTLPDPIAAILKYVGVSSPTQVLVVAPRPFPATGPRPLTRGRGGCR